MVCQNQWPVKNQIVNTCSTTLLFNYKVILPIQFAPKIVKTSPRGLSDGSITAWWHCCSPVVDEVLHVFLLCLISWPMYLKLKPGCRYVIWSEVALININHKGIQKHNVAFNRVRKSLALWGFELSIKLWPIHISFTLHKHPAQKNSDL